MAPGWLHVGRTEAGSQGCTAVILGMPWKGDTWGPIA